MSKDNEGARQLAGWATSGRRRPKLLRGLLRDVRQVLAGARWSGPEDAHLPITHAWPHRPARAGLQRFAPVGLGIALDGPRPDRLPNGPVIFVANHPTANAAELVLARLDPDRRSRTAVVSVPRERVGFLSGLLRRRVLVDFDNPGADGIKLATLLGEGWSVLIFPEGLPAAGATKRPFHHFAATLAEQTGLPVVPVGIRGARAVRATSGVSRVSVRFGSPLHAGADGRDQEAAVDGLIAEDGATWWAVQRSEPGRLPGSKTPQTAHTWRHVWAQTARPRKGGVTETPQIWR